MVQQNTDYTITRPAGYRCWLRMASPVNETPGRQCNVSRRRQLTTWKHGGRGGALSASGGDASVTRGEPYGLPNRIMGNHSCSPSSKKPVRFDESFVRRTMPPPLLRESCPSMHETRLRLLRSRQKETSTPSEYSTGGVPVRQPLKRRRQLIRTGDRQNFAVFNGNCPFFELKA